MQAWKCLFYLSLTLLVTFSLLVPGTIGAQGEVVRPKPREAEKSDLVQPEDNEEPPPERVEIRSIGDLRIGFVPFFSAEHCFDDEGERSFDDWKKKAIKSLLKEDAYRQIEREWIKMDEVDAEVFEELPTSRIRNAADLLKPLANRGIEGVMAIWVEDKGNSYDLVVAFYLPDRIQLEEYRLSANFERSKLPEEPQGGFAEEPTQNLMKELVRRNLNRILPLEGTAHSPAQPTPTNEGSKENGKGEGDDSEEGKGESGGPPTFAVLDFSLEISTEGGTFGSGYVRDLRQYQYAEITRAALQKMIDPRLVLEAQNPQSVTYDQIEAPVIDLDPNADPKAREKALFARAGPGVDALILGHLRPVSQGEQMGARLYVRLLEKDELEYYLDYRDLPDRRKPGEWTQDTIERIVRDLLERAELIPPIISDEFRITVRRGETASSIADKCYRGARFTMELVYSLCEANNLYGNKACGGIKEESTFVIPKQIDRWTRRDQSCRNRHH